MYIPKSYSLQLWVPTKGWKTLYVCKKLVKAAAKRAVLTPLVTRILDEKQKLVS